MRIIEQMQLGYTTYLGFNFGDKSTCHFDTDRQNRHDNIVSHIGDGKYIATFLCDTDHPNGYELHSIYDNGIILVQNNNTKKVVTELIARPNQIKRYWRLQNLDVPNNLDGLLEKCRIHEQKGYNQDVWD